VVRLLRGVRPKLRKFTTDTYIDELAASETWLAQGWSGDVFQAQDQNPDVRYVIRGDAVVTVLAGRTNTSA